MTEACPLEGDAEDIRVREKDYSFRCFISEGDGLGMQLACNCGC